MYLWSSSDSIKVVLKGLEGYLWILKLLQARDTFPDNQRTISKNFDYTAIYIQDERSLTGQALVAAPADYLVAWSMCL